MKKLARILVFGVLVSTFIFGCTSDEENNDSKSPTEQNENASQENSNNENTETLEVDNSNEKEEENNATQNQEKKDAEQKSNLESENTNSNSENETAENTEKTDSENNIDENQANSDDEEQKQEEIPNNAQDSNTDEVKDNSNSENEGEIDSEGDKNKENQEKIDSESENTEKSDDENREKKDGESENKEDNNDTQNQEPADEEKNVIKLYASEVENENLLLADSESYTIELLGKWTSTEMRILSSKLKSITKSHNITLDFAETIGYFSVGVFDECQNLTAKIGRNFFDDANFTISYSHNISDIFRGCKNIVIKDGVTKIPYAAFYKESFGTTTLESITIPASVTIIGYRAFFGCTKLKEVIFEDSDEPIELSFNKDGGPNLFGQGLFYDCPLQKVYIGRNLIYKKEGRYGFSPFTLKRSSTKTEITVGENVTSY